MPHTPYIAPDGSTDWPSVTEVGGIVAKPGLYKFYATHGMAGVQKILDDTALIGLEYHQGIHDRFRGKPETYTTIAKDMVDAFFNEFVAKYQVKPISLEQKVVNIPERYHGTYDGIVHVTNMPWGRGIQGVFTGNILADWKSSSGIYKSHGMQLGGYFGADLQTAKLLNVQHGLIVQVNRDTMKVRRKVFKDLTHYYDVFLNARKLWDFEHGKGAWQE